MEIVDAESPGNWIPCRDVMRLLKIDNQAVWRLVRNGHLGSRQIPGCRTSYFKPDVERLLRESVRPATATPALRPKLAGASA